MKTKKFISTILIVIFITLFLPILNVYAEPSEEPNLYSEAAILIDEKTDKVLFGKNQDERKYPASTTKIITAILTIENCNLDDIVTVDYDSIMQVPSGYTVAALQVGEQLTVKQLLQVMLVHSANDAANVLAKFVGGSIENFATMMNSKLAEIGCTNSHFTNPSGKHDDDHYTTASDLAKMMKYCMKNETFRELIGSKNCIIPETNKYEERVFTNSNDLLIKDTREIDSNYYYPYAIAGKTGYTAEAKNCLVSVSVKDDLELICVILGALRTDEGLSARFVDTKNLFEYGYNNYTLRKVCDVNSIAKRLEISNATKDTKELDLLTTTEINALINQKDLEKDLEPEIVLSNNIEAPITKGDTLGKITYTIEGIEYTSDLVAAHDVEKDNSFFLIIQVIIILILLFIAYKLFLSRNKKYKEFKNNLKNTIINKIKKWTK